MACIEEDMYGQGAMRDGFDGPLGEDGPAPLMMGAPPPMIGEVEERGLGRRRPEYNAMGYEEPMPVVYAGEPDGMGPGYGRRPPPPAPVVYKPEPSDLGMGLMDSGIRGTHDYGSGYGHSDVVGADYGHGRDGGGHDWSERDHEEVEKERKHKHYAEAAAAAAVGYGLYEHRQKNELEDKLEHLGYDSDGNKIPVGKEKEEHHFFH